MFGIDSGEILIIAVVALVVIGPRDLPRVMRTVGHFVGRARGMAKHFRSGFDAMMREAELEEMEKTWRAENDRIMREHPLDGAAADPPAQSNWGQSPAPGPDQRPRPVAPSRSIAAAGMAPSATGTREPPPPPAKDGAP